MRSSRSPAVFLDRDCTLIEDRGDLRSPADVAFYPGTFSALRLLGSRFKLFIVTNQSGVAKGKVTLDEVAAVNAQVVERLRGAGIEVTAVYVCPHQRSDGCACIKPKPFFLKRAAIEHGVDLCRSFVVGDHPHDVDLARNAGATGIYVLTGHGSKHFPEIGEDETVVADISEATAWIQAADIL